MYPNVPYVPVTAQKQGAVGYVGVRWGTLGYVLRVGRSEEMFNARSFLEGLYAPVDEQPSGRDIGPDYLPGDLRVAFEERAAIMEYGGGLPRERAEALALAEVVKHWKGSGNRSRESEKKA